MSKKRGTSNAPMILGVIGGVLGLPGALCSCVCAGMFVGANNANSASLLEVMLNPLSLMFFLAPIAGMVAGILSKEYPKKAGITMIISALVYFLSIIYGSWLLGLVISIIQETKILEA